MNRRRSRRHTNTKAYRSTKNGKREKEIREIAKKLKIPYKKTMVK